MMDTGLDTSIKTTRMMDTGLDTSNMSVRMLGIHVLSLQSPKTKLYERPEMIGWLMRW